MDGYFDADELAVFTSWWLSDDPNSANNWGGGSDVDHGGLVNMKDFAQLANIWLGVSPDPEPIVDDNVFIHIFNSTFVSNGNSDNH